MQLDRVFILLLICCHNVLFFRDGARAMIYKVFMRCLAEFQAGKLLCNLDDVYNLTADFTGSRKVCDFENSECITLGASQSYEEFVNGNVEGLPSSDPLYIDVIKADTANLKHTKYNVTLSGMRHCDTELLKLNIKDKTGQYNLVCKHLIVEGQYEVKGEIGSKLLEGKGYFKENLYDYGLLCTFNFKITFDKAEKHIIADPITVKLDPRGRVDYNFNDNNKQSENGHGITDEDWKKVEESAHSTIMYKLLEIFVKNIKHYIKLVSVEHILSVDV